MSRIWMPLALALSMSMPALAADDPKVLIVVRDGSRDLELMLTEEVGVMKRMLEAEGYAVEVATESGEPMRAGSIELAADLKVSDAHPSRYVGIALPCMAPPPGHPVSSEELALVEAFVAEGKPILAARGSVAVLAKAGGLAGKKYAFASEVNVAERTEFAAGEFLGNGVVRDGNVSTSGVCPLAAKAQEGPDGSEDATRRFIDSLRGEN